MPADPVDAVVAAFRAEGMKGDDELVERFARVAVETCIQEHDGLPGYWVCERCGQPLGADGRCNSGLHTGPGEDANGMAIHTTDLAALAMPRCTCPPTTSTVTLLHEPGCPMAHPSRAAVETCERDTVRLRDALREAAYAVGGGRISQIGMSRVYTPQVNVATVSRWLDLLAEFEIGERDD